MHVIYINGPKGLVSPSLKFVRDDSIGVNLDGCLAVLKNASIDLIIDMAVIKTPRWAPLELKFEKKLPLSLLIRFSFQYNFILHWD